jgi:SAM-dependent methyltransferase
MKNKEEWVPTKFIKTRRGFEPSKNLEYVLAGSRLIAFVQAQAYCKIIQEHSKGLLLDLGCGKVPWYEAYKDLVTDNICIDWVNTLNQSIHLDRMLDLNQVIPIEDNHFDTILATDVLEHISNPKLFISESARLLKPKGKLILAVPFLYKIHEAPYDYYRYTEYALRDFMDKNSLKTIVLEPYGGTPEIILDIISKHVVKYKLLSFLYLNTCKIALNTSFLKNYSQKTAQEFPLGYCLVAEK